jgi:hypothetical protein
MKTLLVIAFLILFPMSARADGWTFGFDGGLAVPTQNYFPTNPGDAGTHSIPYFQALEASEGWMISTYVTHSVIKPWINLGILGSYDTTGASANSLFAPSALCHCPLSGGVKTNLGTLEAWSLMPYLRVNPWTFGSWTPFFGFGLGWSWNQWNTKGWPPYSASISNAFVTRIELGTDYRISDHFSLESLIGFVESDPLASVNLPGDQGGMDQEFQMSLFFFEIGVSFN